MQIPKYILISLLLLSGFSQRIAAQYGFSHEIGGIVGPVWMQSDYGERHDFKTNAGNSGFGIGLVHYLNFSYRAECNCYTPETYFNDHFKVRSELSYNKSKLKHFGEWVDNNKQDLWTRQLRAMRGKTSVTNIGVQLEWYPFSIRDFTASIGHLAPFISLGGQFCFYDPEAYSTIGDGKLNTPATTPIKYYNATQNDGGTAWSVVGSLGTRYKLAPLSDLLVDLRVQYYFSNWIDGLNPNPDVYPENKANDWLIWFNVGYIYYLQ